MFISTSTCFHGFRTGFPLELPSAASSKLLREGYDRGFSKSLGGDSIIYRVLYPQEQCQLTKAKFDFSHLLQTKVLPDVIRIIVNSVVRIPYVLTKPGSHGSCCHRYVKSGELEGTSTLLMYMTSSKLSFNKMIVGDHQKVSNHTYHVYMYAYSLTVASDLWKRHIFKFDVTKPTRQVSQPRWVPSATWSLVVWKWKQIANSLWSLAE